jgi:hypothetical protein
LPLRRAIVTLGTAVNLLREPLQIVTSGTAVVVNPTRDPLPSVATDENGYYEFDNLPPGSYALHASKSGYASLAYGQRRQNMPHRTVDTASPLAGQVDFALPPAGAIVVRLTDGLGAPLSGIAIEAEQFRLIGGERRLVPVGRARTDDRGQARLAGLWPGVYFVVAQASGVTVDPQLIGLIGVRSPIAGQKEMFPRSYYPGRATANEAQSVTLLARQELTIVFSIHPVPASRVSGSVRRADGSAPSQGTIRMLHEGGEASPARSATIFSNGTFQIPEVPPGRYALHVRPASESRTLREQAMVSLIVGGEDLAGLVVTTSRGATLSGRFVFEDGQPSADITAGALYATAHAAALTTAADEGDFTSLPDWRFEFAGLLGPTVLRLGTPSHGWALKRIMHGGNDVTDVPFDFAGGKDVKDVELVLTRVRTELSGTGVDERNSPVSEYSVVVFPEDRALWTPQSRFIGAARSDDKGRFELTGLPSGRFLIAALDYLGAGEERDIDLLSRIAGSATPVTLEGGKPATITLRVMPY